MDKVSITKTLCGMDVTDATISVYLEVAKEVMLQRLFPFASDVSNYEVPKKFDLLQCEITAELIQKRGAEGETSHSEDGINRVYENASVSKSLLDRLTPCVHVPTVNTQYENA